MQDIRKPYTRSRSNEDLQTRLERFQDGRYKESRGYEDDEPVRIPVRGIRKDVRPVEFRGNRTDYEEDVDWQDEEPYRTRSVTREQRPRPRSRKVGASSLLIWFVSLALLTGAVLYTYVFDSATITVVPKYKDVQNFSKVITFEKEGGRAGTVPYLVETKELSKSKVLTRSESRKVETKASGRAIIYNNFDSEPQKLIKNTRFESSTGKIYRIAESVTVPGKKGAEPGSVEVTLFADSNGSDYNMSGQENFTIPGFKGTPRYTLFSAKSKAGISGGSSGSKSLVSLSDINAAKDALAIELEKEIKAELSKVTKEGYVPMQSAVQVVFNDNENELLNGEGEMYKVTGTGYLMLAQSSRLAEVVAESIVDYEKAPVRLVYGDILDFVRRDTTSIVNATSIPLLVEGSPRVVWQVDKDALKAMVESKDTNEFKSLMKSIDSIESAEIRFSPMWLSSFPSDEKKIFIEESLPKR